MQKQVEEEVHECSGPPPELHLPDMTDWHFGDEEYENMPAPPWVMTGDQQRVSEGQEGHEGFAWRPGKDKCTQGIWLWSSPFVFVGKDGRRIAVLLMDTQGAWDDTMTRAQSATIFGLTSLLSHKLVYNIQNRIEEVQMENLDYITTFAQTVCSDLPGKDAPFGHLQLLVRDWVNFEDGFTMDECKGQMAQHQKDHLSLESAVEDARDRVERLHQTFKSIHTFGLCHPGRKVTRPKYSGEINQIEADFMALLDEFMQELFGDSFPQPSAPLGCEVTVESFHRVVMNFAKAFCDNAKLMARGMREAFVKIEMMSYRDELLKRFREQSNKIAPETSVVDPMGLERNLVVLKNTLVGEFATKLKPWKLADEQELVREFDCALSDAVRQRIWSNDQQVEGATMKLVASPVIGGGAYFIFVHHWILYGVMGLGFVMHVKKFTNKHHVDAWSPVVVHGIVGDAKNFFIQRKKDVQAMQIALTRCNPNDAMDSVMKITTRLGLAAGQAGLMANAPPPGPPGPGGHQGPPVGSMMPMQGMPMGTMQGMQGMQGMPMGSTMGGMGLQTGGYSKQDSWTRRR